MDCAEVKMASHPNEFAALHGPTIGMVPGIKTHAELIRFKNNIIRLQELHIKCLRIILDLESKNFINLTSWEKWCHYFIKKVNGKISDLSEKTNYPNPPENFDADVFSVEVQTLEEDFLCYPEEEEVDKVLDRIMEDVD